jgi:fibrillarin-like pre-rRNA processing protein
MELNEHYLPNVLISPDGRSIYTVNFDPGKRVYEEDLLTYEGRELRKWIPFRSKFAALLLKGVKTIELEHSSKVLYLGAAAGTTPSHISDIIDLGRVFCVEFSERPFRDLVRLCERRQNMIPILANARKPEEYRPIVERVDFLYQDISQRDQVEIFIKNIKNFLKKDGFGLIMIKSRSIDVNKPPESIYEIVQNKLKSEDFQILDKKILSPFQKDHAAFVVTYV